MEPNDLAILQDMLALVDVRVTMRELEHRSAEERLAAEVWAGREHVVACYTRESLAPVRRLPKPAWLPKSETEKRLARRTS